MREYRGQRADNGEWVEGFLLKTKEHTYIAYDEQYDDDLFLSPKNIFVEVIPETVGQHIGITDKKGRKIFEGDILSERPPMNNVAFIGRVIYSDENSAFEIVFDTGRSFVLGTYSKSYTIIGNIHDNPELLKGGAEE